MQQSSLTSSGNSGASVQDLMQKLGNFIGSMRSMSELDESTLREHYELESSLGSALLSQQASGAEDGQSSSISAKSEAASEPEIAHSKIKAEWQELTDQGDAVIILRAYKDGRTPARVPDCGKVLQGLLYHRLAYVTKDKLLPRGLNIEKLELLASICLERNRFLTERGFELFCEALLAEEAPTTSLIPGYDAFFRRMRNTQDRLRTLSAIRAAGTEGAAGRDKVD